MAALDRANSDTELVSGDAAALMLPGLPMGVPASVWAATGAAADVAGMGALQATRRTSLPYPGDARTDSPGGATPHGSGSPSGARAAGAAGKPLPTSPGGMPHSRSHMSLNAELLGTGSPLPPVERPSHSARHAYVPSQAERHSGSARHAHAPPPMEGPGGSARHAHAPPPTEGPGGSSMSRNPSAATQLPAGMGVRSGKGVPAPVKGSQAPLPKEERGLSRQSLPIWEQARAEGAAPMQAPQPKKAVAHYRPGKAAKAALYER